MKRFLRVGALLLALATMMSFLAGCDNLLQSNKFRSCERVAEQVAKGRDFTKEDVVAAVGKPDYFENKTEGADYMDAEVTWWRYEVPEFSGYPWRLSLNFDRNGNVTSAEFRAAPGG